MTNIDYPKRASYETIQDYVRIGWPGKSSTDAKYE